MIEIRELIENDVDRIVELEKSSAPTHPIYYGWDKEDLLKKIINASESKAFGAFDGQKMVGWSGYKYEGDGEYQICGIVVDKSHRRLGIGEKLLKVRMDDLLKKEGVKKIYSTNYPKNSPIIIMLLKRGFVIDDFKKDFYGPAADRIFMSYQVKED